MDTEKVLYKITVEDVINVSEEIEIDFEKSDIDFIQERIGAFFDSKWYEAIEFALIELENSDKNKV